MTGINYTGILIQTMGISAYWSVSYLSEPFYVFDDKYTINTGDTKIALKPVVLSPSPSANKTQTDVIYIKKGETT
jgi:hypothetical protein